MKKRFKFMQGDRVVMVGKSPYARQAGTYVKMEITPVGERHLIWLDSNLRTLARLEDFKYIGDL